MARYIFRINIDDTAQWFNSSLPTYDISGAQIQRKHRIGRRFLVNSANGSHNENALIQFRIECHQRQIACARRVPSVPARYLFIVFGKQFKR